MIPLLLTFTLLAPQLHLAQSHSQPQSLVLTHVTVIDATSAAAKPDMTVVITGDHITALGRSATVRVPTNALVIDASGKFLIPGMWDMHGHLHGPSSYLPGIPHLSLLIANGVTGLRDAASPMQFLEEIRRMRKEIADGTLLGPRIVAAGPLVDGPKPIFPNSIAVSNEREGRLAVTSIKQHGADFVKVYNLLPRNAHFAIAAEAMRQHIPFFGHVPISVSAAEASDAGQASIEHLTGVLLACSSREAEIRKADEAGEPWSELMHTILETYSEEKAEALLARFKRNHTWQCPTLVWLHHGMSLADKSAFNEARLKFIPAAVKEEWSHERRFERLIADGNSATYKQYVQKQADIVAAMQRAGVELLAGTDMPRPFLLPGFSLQDELVLLVEAGLTPMEAMKAATINPARFLGKEKELGTVEVGKLADLVLLDANPLRDIRNTQKVNAVVVNGRLLDRKALDNLLDEVEAAAKQ
jgi:imidazolonepropionase-like amidohydrolase